MKKTLFNLFLIVLLFLVVGCENKPDENPYPEPNNPSEIPNNPSDGPNNPSEDRNDPNPDHDITVDKSNHSYKLKNSNGNNFYFICEDCNDEYTLQIEWQSGTKGVVNVTDSTITFGNITEESVYSISGKFYGNIIIAITNEFEFELEFNQFDLYSYNDCPINISSNEKVILSSKKNTQNNIYDLRDTTTEDEIASAIYALCDLNIQGKGELNVKSENNNGIHTKDDLKVKNVSLTVDCQDNALKGNDSVEIESGTIVLIARTGDAIKTTNSSISSKGKQKGTVSLFGGDILIYSASDGIDSAYDVLINEQSTNLNLQIFTDKYSKYSEEVVEVKEATYYIRANNTNYKYSICYFDVNNNEKWYSSTSYETEKGDRGRTYYYYPITKPSNYESMIVYVYTSQEQNQKDNYEFKSEKLNLNNNFDTITISNQIFDWANKNSMRPDFGGIGGPGGMGRPNDGNSDKKDLSTKGIKASNQIIIDGGNVIINSYDDSLHSNISTLENNTNGLGNIIINGGTLKFHSNDDGIHADNSVTINGGTINVEYSYEGIEGKVVTINDGNVSVYALDDGINGINTSNEAIIINGGTLYIVAQGDGVDSNSKTSYNGIVFAGGNIVIISTGNGDSSIDTERGYKYTGGNVVAIGQSGGMSNEAKNCQNFNSIATSKSMQLTAGNYLVIDNLVTIQITKTMNAQVIYLGSNSVNISTSANINSDSIVEWK